jgi:putative ABC transport system ATP-binding protein
MPLIEARNVYKTYTLGNQKFNALDGVSLVIEKGEYIAIMGPSGSGKSTLMHIIGCLDVPTTGQYLFKGRDITSLSDRELAQLRNSEIGFVFQSFNLLARISAFKNVEMPMMYARRSAAERRRKVDAALERVGLAGRRNNKPNELSGGEMQRVAIARALINDPAIILADEPTGNLDSRTGVEIMKLFDDLARQGNTLILVTHDAGVARHARRIVRIVDGRIETGDRPAQVENLEGPLGDVGLPASPTPNPRPPSPDPQSLTPVPRPLAP